MEVLFEGGVVLPQAKDWLKSSLLRLKANAALIVANMARSGKYLMCGISVCTHSYSGVLPHFYLIDID